MEHSLPSDPTAKAEQLGSAARLPTSTHVKEDPIRETSEALSNKLSLTSNYEDEEQDVFPEQQVRRQETNASEVSFHSRFPRRTNTGWSAVSAASTMTTDTELDIATEDDDHNASAPPGFSSPCRSNTESSLGNPSRTSSFPVPVPVPDRDNNRPGRSALPLEYPSLASRLLNLHRLQDMSSPSPMGQHGHDPTPQRAPNPFITVPLTSPTDDDLVTPIARRSDGGADQYAPSLPSESSAMTVTGDAQDEDDDIDIEEDEDWTPEDLSMSQTSDASESFCDLDTSSLQTPDTKLKHDVCDKLLKQVFGVDIQELTTSDAAAEVFNSVSNCLDEMSRIVSNNLVTFSLPIREVPNRQNQHPNRAPPQPSETGSTPPGQGNGGNGNGRGSKRPVDDNFGREGFGGNEGAGGNGGKRPRTGPAQPPQPEDQHFSCPYRKRNSVKFNIRDHQSCAVQSFPDISQLKRHVKIFHKQKTGSTGLECARCKTNFGNRDEYDKHIAAPNNRVCTFRQIPLSEDPEDGINARTEDLLNGRRANTKVDSWELLWKTLFPDDDLSEIPDHLFVPPIESDEVLAVFQSRDFLNQLRQRVAEEEESSAAEAHGPDLERHITKMVQLYVECNNAGFDSCRMELLGNLPAPQRRKRTQKQKGTQSPTEQRNQTLSTLQTSNLQPPTSGSNVGTPSSAGSSWHNVNQSTLQSATLAPQFPHDVSMYPETADVNTMDANMGAHRITGPGLGPYSPAEGGRDNIAQLSYHSRADSAVSLPVNLPVNVYPRQPIPAQQFITQASQASYQQPFPGQQMMRGNNPNVFSQGQGQISVSMEAMGGLGAGSVLPNQFFQVFHDGMDHGEFGDFQQQ